MNTHDPRNLLETWELDLIADVQATRWLSFTHARIDWLAESLTRHADRAEDALQEVRDLLLHCN